MTEVSKMDIDVDALVEKLSPPVDDDTEAEGARADMPRSLPDHDDYADHDGLDPIQRMHLDSDRRAAASVREAAKRSGLTPGGTCREQSTYDENASRAQKAAIDGHRPDSNPKSALGIKKVPLHLVSPISVLHEAMAMAEGGMKYGPYNYRKDSVAATVYIAAALRHIMDWAMGEENASDSGIHHLGHAKACCGILLDAQACGSLIDDRYKTEAYAELLKMYTAMLPAMAERIAAMSKDLEAHQREQD